MTPSSEAEAVKQYTPFVTKTAKSYAKSGPAYEDLLQEGLLAVALAFRTFRKDGGANFLTWIHRPVHFAMRGLLREHNRNGGSQRGGPKQSILLLPLEESPVPPAYQRSPDRTTRWRELPQLSSSSKEEDVFLRDRLREAVQDLKPQAQRILRWRFEKGLSLDETAEKMRLGKRLVTELEHEALAQLKEVLSE